MKQPNPEEEWMAYRTACYGSHILNPTQETETRQAFLSGIAQGISTMIEMTKTLGENEAVETLDKYSKEVRIRALAGAPTRDQ